MDSRLGQSKGNNSPQRRLYSPLLDPATHHHKWLCKSPQEPLPDRGIACTYAKECSRIGNKTEISWVLQKTFPGSQTQQLVEFYVDSLP